MLKRIRSLVSNSSFIEIYDNALSKKQCEILINQFEKSYPIPLVVNQIGNEKTLVHEANVWSTYRPDYKKCVQLSPDLSDNTVIGNIIRPCIVEYLKRYKEFYPSLKEISDWECFNRYNFQKYERDGDGYKIWHCEHGPGLECSDRMLAWMFYLNNAKSGTEFMHYPTIRAKLGRLVIWPSAWTHVHKGVIPNKGLKYIVTGWASFKNEK